MPRECARMEPEGLPTNESYADDRSFHISDKTMPRQSDGSSPYKSVPTIQTKHGKSTKFDLRNDQNTQRSQNPELTNFTRLDPFAFNFLDKTEHLKYRYVFNWCVSNTSAPNTVK